jgi:hypothetical protein
VAEADIEVLRNYVQLLRLPTAARMRACAQLLEARAGSSAPLPLSTCIFAASHGCSERAFDVIDDALDNGRPLCADNHQGFGMARAQSPLQLFVGVGGEPIWRSPRFAKLCVRLGLAQYWLESGAWPDCADDVAYDFRLACGEAVSSRSVD